jgi:outer membrane receptor protein involved in Fe transport
MGIRAFSVLLAGTALTFAGQAMAQAAAEADKPDNESIIVTGTRIVRDGYEAPTPVTVATVEELVKSTPSSIPDALNKLPQFSNSFGPSRSASNFSNLPIHGNVLNLRGLGTTGTNPKGPLRTLIMFDGLRVPGTTYIGTVDTNVLPQMLIQRVDVVTGGASASYGSDAVAGVVNFILDRKFTGIKGVAQYGVSSRGDNDNYRLGIAGGLNFADDRGHAMFSAEMYSNSGMLRNQRDIGRGGYAYVNAATSCTNTTSDPLACTPGGSLNPYSIAANVTISAASEFGKINASSVGASFPFLNYVFNADGTFRPFVNGTPTGGSGATAIQIGGEGYRIPDKTHTIKPVKTYQFFGRVDYDVAEDVNFYVQGIYSRQNLRYSPLANSLVTPATLFKGNPFIPAAIADQLPDGGSINVSAYNAGGPGTSVVERTDYYMGSLGIDAKVGDNWKVALSYTHGRSTHDMQQSGLYDWRKLFAAVDVVSMGGTPTCRVLTDSATAAAFAGCQPMNILRGLPSVTSPAGYAYATGTSRYHATSKQDSVVFTVTGSPFEMPAGPVDIVVGAEYRKDSLLLTSNADPALLDTAAERTAYFAGLRGVNATSFYWLTNVGTANASSNVKEVFGEIAIPLLRDKPGFVDLSLNGAVRLTDYSSSGSVTTWKFGGVWKPINDLTLRATYSRDIRAPNLFELFAGDTLAISIINDPFNAATGIGSGTNVNRDQVGGGNPLLRPEVAKTLSFGGVITPQGIPGLSLSIDYYRIRLAGAINGLTSQLIVNNCTNFGATAPECALITRSGGLTSPISLIRNAEANISFINTSGIDFDLSYRTGPFSARLYLNYLAEFKTQLNNGQPVIDWAGGNVVGSNPIAYPRLRGNLSLDYSKGRFGVTLTEQMIGSMGRFINAVNPLPGASNFAGGKVGAVFYTDLTLRYKLPVMNDGVEAFFTANNLFDKKPPLIPGVTPGVNLPTNIGVYDVIGMAFTAGVRFKF